MNDWSIPDWGDPWEPSLEIPCLNALADLVESQWPHIRCMPDFTTTGAAFVEFHTGDICIGRACVSTLNPDKPFFSCYLGADEDEFHGYSMQAAASVVGHYINELPDSE